MTHPALLQFRDTPRSLGDDLDACLRYEIQALKDRLAAAESRAAYAEDRLHKLVWVQFENNQLADKLAYAELELAKRQDAAL